MSDQRRRAHTQAVHVSKLGKGNPIGSVQRLEASPIYSINFTADAGVATAVNIGVLSEGSYVTAGYSHLALSTGTVALKLVDPTGVVGDVTLVAAGALNAAATLGVTAFYTPLSSDRILTATISTGTASETAQLSLTVGVVTPEWH